jgi:cob(I)alamin adenosyltransferase
MLEKGLVQIYTGDGKGKTTAALGLALRAAGQGNKVLIYQFLKPPGLETGERFALQMEAVKIRFETLDVPWDMSTALRDEKAVRQMREALARVIDKIVQIAEKRDYDVLILDEIVFCFSNGLIELDDIRRIIDKRNPGVEIILTGRGATQELIELADLVTEMKNIKHPFDKGLPARRGIEY